MRRIKLTRKEKTIENALLRGDYQSIGRTAFEEIAHAIVKRRKDAVLNIRVNSQDLESIKQKASKLGVKYQTFISEFLHRLAQS